jgi:tetratricopeptide (TPR) repeat protein
MIRFYTTALAVIALCTAALADEKASTLDYIASLPKPAVMDGIGNSNLKITTDSDKAQRYFNQGVSLLHDFWWFEAYRSFTEAARLDPDAPMPHWGIYMATRSMANLGKDTREELQNQAIEYMQERRDNASRREQYYMDAVMHLHEKEGEAADEAYQDELEALMAKYPDEIEARLFLWLALDGGFDMHGHPRGDQMYGHLLLETALSEHPDHQGLLHYWIHSQEVSEQPENALEAAERLASLAPNAGHIVHMPGHIHFRVGNYDQAHEQFALADDADRRYMQTYGVDTVFTWNYLHNISFLIANLAEAGRFDEATAYADSFATMAAESEYKDYVGFTMIAGRAELEPFLLQLRSGDFEKAAAALRQTPAVDGVDEHSLQLRRQAYQAYAEGMAAVSRGDTDAGAASADQLDALLMRTQRDEQRLPGRSIFEILSLELLGMVEHAGGNSERGMELLERALTKELELRYREPPPNVRPVHESIAAVHLENDNWEKARASYRKVTEMRKHSGYGLFGIAKAYELEGKHDLARTAYTEFLERWASADDDRPRVVHARQWLAAN